jgi:N-acyl-D-amino-acid deacylase
LELLLRNATIIDGTGAPSRTGDIAISGDRIRAVGPPQSQGPTKGAACPVARVEIDCAGLVVAPGFIDIHSHSDFSLFLTPAAPNYLFQGVTLVVNGNCGFSGAPIDLSRPDMAAFTGEDRRVRDIVNWESFAEYLAALDRLPKAINVAALVGHANVRVAAVGPTDRAPTAGDLEKMKALVREAMSAGAFGLSTGLIYAPGVFALTEEIVELASVASEFGGLYATHVRSESDLLVEAVLEAVRIGRESGCRVQVAHHKAGGRRNWGLVKTTLDLMEYYRRLGVEISCDVYPCTAGATSLSALFPPWTHRGGKDGFLTLLGNKAERERIKRDLSRPNPQWPNLYFDAGPDGVRLAESRAMPQNLGLSVADIAAAEGKDPLDVMLDLILQDFDAGVTVGGMCEEDMRYVLSHRLSLVASDSAATAPGEGLPHPRAYRAFTRTLATYARDERLLTLEQAVHKMSGLPAWKLGLPDRGVLRPGAKADVAVFDLWGLAAPSDFGDPHHFSRGMVHVLISGEFVIRDGRPTEARPGELVRRQEP